MELPSRTVIREPEFEEQLRAIVSDAEEADAFTLGAEVVLARDPTLGTPASRDGTVWVLPMMPVRGMRVSLFYTFNARAVVFLAIVAEHD